MIFKTFNNNIDKISAKWGIFGNSFYDISTAIVGRITDINKNFQATDDLIGSIKNSDSTWKRLYPSKADIQSQLINVNSILPEINESPANKILHIIKSIEDGTYEEVNSFQELYNTGKKQNQWIAEYAQSTQGQIRSTEGVIQANQAARQAAIDHNNALKQQTLSAKAATTASKALAMAGNMIAFTLIAKGIEAAITAIDNYVHRAEYAIKAMEEAQEENASSQSDLRESSSTISENRERFLELSKGVDRFSNNVSLSDEDYAEYLDISNQIAALSPSLIQSYDEQGNALLRLGDNAKATGDILDQVLETEQNVAQQTLIDNMGKVAAGVYHQVDEARKNIKELENELHDASFYEGISMLEHLFEDVNENTKMIRLDTSTGFTQEQIEELKNVVLNSGARAFVDEFGNSISFYAGDTDLVEKAISDYYSQINETQRKEAEAHVNGIKEDIRKEENSIKNAYAQMNSSLSAWAKNTYETVSEHP